MDFRVDFTSENILPDGSNFGYVGEHNVATLVITPPSSMTDNAEIKYICLACEVGKDFIKAVVRSELYKKTAEIKIPLWAQATIGESAKLQLEGYDGNDNILIKSELIDYVLSPSVNGVQAATDMSGGSLAGTVAANKKRIEELAQNGGGKVKKIFIPYNNDMETACYAFNIISDILAFYLVTSYAEENNLIDILPVDMSIKYMGEERFISELAYNANIAADHSSTLHLQKPKDIDDSGDLTFAILTKTAGSKNSLFNAVNSGNGNIEGVYLYYFDNIAEVTE